MITPTPSAPLTPPEKAQLIYQQVQSDMAGRLWRAALGGDEAQGVSAGAMKEGPISLELLITLLDERGSTPRPLSQPLVPAQAEAADALDPDGQRQRQRPDVIAQSADDDGAPANVTGKGYGPNAVYVGFLSAAGHRTGLPPAALATIVHAEAAKDSDGRWLPYSRNPRSSAAGLGQFLSGTWVDEAGRRGTWLNSMAEQQGWLARNGQVKSEHRAALLALRYDPEAAIQATADYAASNVKALRKAGAIGVGSSQAIAQAAYLGHHLGRGDAISFLKGGLSPERARVLLNAQVGVAASARRIADSGNATSAHKLWLTDYISNNIQVKRFLA